MMKINPPMFTKYCKDCYTADLTIDSAKVKTSSISNLAGVDKKTWYANCAHREACARIARIVEEGEMYE